MPFSKLAFLFVLVFFVVFINIVSSKENSTNNGRFFTGGDLLESGRKKKKTNKYLIPILFGALMIKSIIFPLAFKAMAVMSSVAVLLSTMSLIVSSIVGYVKLAMKPNPQIKVVHVNDIIPQTWAKDDDGVKSYALETIDYEASSPVESYRPYYYN